MTKVRDNAPVASELFETMLKHPRCSRMHSYMCYRWFVTILPAWHCQKAVVLQLDISHFSSYIVTSLCRNIPVAWFLSMPINANLCNYCKALSFASLFSPNFHCRLCITCFTMPCISGTRVSLIICVPLVMVIVFVDFCHYSFVIVLNPSHFEKKCYTCVNFINSHHLVVICLFVTHV